MHSIIYTDNMESTEESIYADMQDTADYVAAIDEDPSEYLHGLVDDMRFAIRDLYKDGMLKLEGKTLTISSSYVKAFRLNKLTKIKERVDNMLESSNYKDMFFLQTLISDTFGTYIEHDGYGTMSLDDWMYRLPEDKDTVFNCCGVFDYHW